MTLHQLIESSLCGYIYHALEGIETFCNAARLQFGILQNSLYLSIKALMDKTACRLVRGVITCLQ